MPISQKEMSVFGTRRFGSLAPLLLTVWAMGTQASTLAPVTIDAVFKTTTAGDRGVLTLSIESSVTREARVDVTAVDGFIEVVPSSATTRLDLRAGRGHTFSVDLESRGSDQLPYGSVRIRVLGNEDSPMAVTILHFADVDNALRIVSPDDFDELVLVSAAQAEAAHAAATSRTLADVARKRGKTPVPWLGMASETLESRADVESPSQKAWNDVAQRPSPALPICGPFYVGENFTYVVTADPFYYDPHDLATYRMGSGYPVAFQTRRLFEDDCGNIQYRTTTFSATTDANGKATATVVSAVRPGEGDPVVRFGATAPDAGIRNGTSITTVTQYVSGTSLWGFWVGDQYRMQPLFDTIVAPQNYFFRWNAEIKSLQQRWALNGFGSSYTPFKAGYDSSSTGGALFLPVSPGVVSFGVTGRYTLRWIMAHEFGHFFQFKLQGNALAPGGGAHQYCQVLLASTAFAEGFADWHGAYWETDGREFIVPCIGGECYSTCEPGYLREGNVQAFFWDLFDSQNSGTYDGGIDTVQFGLGLLKNWISYGSFPSFYNDFTARGIWGSQASVVEGLRAVNHVDVPQ